MRRSVVVEFGADFGSLDRIAGKNRGDERGEDFFGFEADVKLGFIDLVGEFEAEAFGFCEHANDAALGGLGGAAMSSGLIFIWSRRSAAALLISARRTGSSRRSCCAMRVAHSERRRRLGIFWM